jgi:hypothetical protein
MLFGRGENMVVAMKKKQPMVVEKKKNMNASKSKSNKQKTMMKKMLENLNKTCPPGQIFRKGAYRNGYVRSNGVEVKGTYIPGQCIPNVGKPGHSEPISVNNTNKGLLSDLGYSLDLPQKTRQAILKKAMLLYPPLKVLKHVNYIRTLHKSDPENYKKLDEDMHFIQHEYRKMKEEIEKVIQKVNMSSKKMNPTENTPIVQKNTPQLVPMGGKKSMKKKSKSKKSKKTTKKTTKKSIFSLW